MKWFRSLVVAILFVVVSSLLLPAFTSAAHADSGKLNLKDLTEGADSVLVGTVTDQTSYWNDEHTLIYTTVGFSVEARLKGTGSQDKVSITVDGGEVDGIGEIVSDMATFQNGERAVVFLKKINSTELPQSAALRASPEEQFQVYNGYKGKFSIKGDKVDSLSVSDFKGRVNTILSGGTLPETELLVEPPSATSYYLPLGYSWPHPPAPVVSYWINDNTSDCTDEVAALQNAAATWSSAGANFSLIYDGYTAATAAGRDGVNEIMWRNFGSAGILAQAWLWYQGSNILENDIEFNDYYSWSSSPTCPAGYYDVETIGLHELGHWVGLADLYSSADADKVMYGYGSPGHTKRVLTADDIAGIQAIYGTAVQPTITVTSPNGGETWYIGDSDNITWNSSHLTGNVDIYVSRDGGSTWSAITPTGGIPNTSPYSWTVIGPAAATARIKVASVTTPSIFDTSDANFAISAGTIAVTSPNGGETWYIGDSNNITWNSSHLAGNVDIYVSRNGGSTWSAITPTGGIPNTNSYSWAVTGPTATTARIKVASAATPSIFDTSNANFAIPAGTITVTSPNGGEIWYIGDSNNITWNSFHMTDNVNIYVSRNGGSTWSAITPSGGIPNTNSYSWTVTGPPAATTRIKVASAVTPSVFDTSNANFAIPPGTIAVTSPNGGETWYIGDNDNITWNSFHMDGKVNIYVSRNGGSTWAAITPVGGVTNINSYSWLVKGPAVTKARIKVASVTTPTVFDTSDANFAISAGTITVTSPNGGETWYIGDSNNITWSSFHLAGKVNIYVSRNGGSTWSAITPVGGIPNTNSYVWTVTGPAAATARIKVSSVTTPTVFDTGNANFAISAGTIAVTFPNGGETWYIGDNDNITWSSFHLAGKVNIYVSRNGGSTWSAITPSGGIPNTSPYSWTVKGPAAATARIKVSSVTYPTVLDTSNANFAISAPP